MVRDLFSMAVLLHFWKTREAAVPAEADKDRMKTCLTSLVFLRHIVLGRLHKVKEYYDAFSGKLCYNEFKS
jgi:hypothetical protein